VCTTERKVGFVHISCAKSAGGTIYGNWRPQFVPAPEISTSFEERRQKKNENTKNKTVSVLGSLEFQLSLTSVKYVTSAAYVFEQERSPASLVVQQFCFNCRCDKMAGSLCRLNWEGRTGPSFIAAGTLGQSKRGGPYQ
jgi:hypothetical protein